MDALDPQRQRILVSFLDEFQSSLTFGASDASRSSQTLEQEAQPIVSGEYVQMLTSEEAQLRQDMRAPQPRNSWKENSDEHLHARPRDAESRCCFPGTLLPSHAEERHADVPPVPAMAASMRA